MPVCLGVFLFCPFFLACSEKPLPPGVVATVNGDPVTLHEVQTLLDSRSAGLGLQSDATFEEIRINYGKALAMLVVNTLVRQELQERGLAPDKNDLEQALERISSDYGEESLEEYLADASLRPEDWRQLMADHLALEIFRNQILLPGIKIEFQDVKNYYQEHKKDFILPETAMTCFLAAPRREDIQDWCQNIKFRILAEDNVAQCVEVPIREIPQPWNKELRNLTPMSCGKIREEDGEWQAVALLEKKGERTPELSEVFPLVEKILLEPKQAAAFQHWLEQKLAASKVMVTAGLKEAMTSSLAQTQPISVLRESAK